MITELKDFDLTRHNTFGMRVKCARWIEYTSAGDLPEIMRQIGDLPFKAIGEGSNLLFEGDYEGALLHSRVLDMEAGIDDNGDFLLTAGAGLIFDDVVAHVCRAGIWGMENLSAIPGQVGAAAVQNIGAYGVEVADIIDEVLCYDTAERREVAFTASDCRYGYRMSVFKTPEAAGRYIVTSVRFRLPAGAVRVWITAIFVRRLATRSLRRCRCVRLSLRCAVLSCPRSMNLAAPAVSSKTR